MRILVQGLTRLRETGIRRMLTFLNLIGSNFNFLKLTILLLFLHMKTYLVMKRQRQANYWNRRTQRKALQGKDRIELVLDSMEWAVSSIRLVKVLTSMPRKWEESQEELVIPLLLLLSDLEATMWTREMSFLSISTNLVLTSYLKLTEDLYLLILCLKWKRGRLLITYLTRMTLMMISTQCLDLDSTHRSQHSNPLRCLRACSSLALQSRDSRITVELVLIK